MVTRKNEEILRINKYFLKLVRNNLIFSLVILGITYFLKLSFQEFLILFILYFFANDYALNKEMTFKKFSKRLLFSTFFMVLLYVVYHYLGGAFGIVWGVIIFSVLFALYRIVTGWDQFLLSIKLIETLVFGKTQDKQRLTLKEVTKKYEKEYNKRGKK